jgi:ferric-dicitrate binding protein FerR (iron transport regulator)
VLYNLNTSTGAATIIGNTSLSFIAAMVWVGGALGVAVVGTVFSVNARPSGSRVSVLEGEVHVRHGGVSEVLRPGHDGACDQTDDETNDDVPNNV